MNAKSKYILRRKKERDNGEKENLHREKTEWSNENDKFNDLKGSKKSAGENLRKAFKRFPIENARMQPKNKSTHR